MDKFKHLTQEERIVIELRLNERTSFRSIAKELGKDPTTISKEIRTHIQFKQTGCFGRSFNDCKNRFGCPVKKLCGKPGCNRKCCYCSFQRCTTICSDYIQEICQRLSKAPYVCNGCPDRNKCTLEKRVYSAKHAQKEYEAVRSESRKGIQLTEEEAVRLDERISPLIMKGQSLHHIYVTHADEIMVDQRSLYNYVASGIFEARNVDMPRVVRMGKRKKKKAEFKVDKHCRQGRTYPEFLSFLEQNPGVAVTEIDSVIGRVGGKVLLTIHFRVPQFMLAFLRDHNTSQSVIDVFNRLNQILGPDDFRRVFQVLLADNGSEFSNPSAIENDDRGQSRTLLFYCDPQAPFQKGALENNHSLLRRVIPKGTSMDHLTQGDIDLMMDHINSYTRENLGDKSPYQIFSHFYGEEILRRMGARLIHPDEITLHPSLLKN